MLPDHELNRASWDRLAEVHGQDAYYDADALCAGASSLIPEEEAALSLALGAAIAGTRVLHLQCHLGFDAITFARRGARVTGVDFSLVALEKARDLAVRCAVDVDWICADALELPDSLTESFDLVWATIGVLCWIADVSAWMRSVCRALVPGGKLVLIDGMPKPAFMESLSETDRQTSQLRRVIEEGLDYATPLRTGPQVQFYRSTQTVVAAAEATGLAVRHLEEHRSISTDLRLGHVRGSDGRFGKLDGRKVLFTLIAERTSR